MIKEKFKLLKKEWEKFTIKIDNDEKEKVDKCFENYIEKIANKSMTLVNYAGGDGNNDNDCGYFTTFLEVKSRKIYGSAKPGTMFNAGIYYSKEDKLYYIDDDIIENENLSYEPKKNIRKQNKDRKYYDKDIAEKVFKNKILPYLKDIIISEEFDTYKQIEYEKYKIENKDEKRPIKAKLFLRKIVAMNNKGKFLYIYSDEMIDQLYKFFVLKDDEQNEMTNLEKNKKIVEKAKNIFSNNKQNDEEYVLKLSNFLWTKFKFTMDFDAKNIILHGAPGTGKTYFAEENVKVKQMLEEATYTIVQFHPSYTYEDFIDGIKPIGINKNGQMQFELKNGVFKQMCIDAFKELVNAKKENKEPKKFYFIADEINRAELSRVFGELLLCLEEDKRLRFDENGNLQGTKVKTANSMLWHVKDAVVIIKKDSNEIVTDIEENKEYDFYFGVPENVYFIGTMNDIDRSIDSFDLALRRRFFWKQMDCDYEVILDKLNQYTNIGDIESNDKYTGFLKVCYDLNQYITTDKKFKDKNGKKETEIEGLNLGTIYEIGHAYFLKVAKFIGKQTKQIKEEYLKKLFDFSIEPLLREYLRATYDEKETEDKLKKARKIFSLK